MSITQISENKKSHQQRIFEFQKELESFCILAAHQGYKVNPHTPETLAKMQELSPQDLSRIQEDFRAYDRVIRDAAPAESTSVDNVMVFWSLLKDLKLRPTSDIFSYIGKDDVVEVYGIDFRQIFRNLRFFDYCSYALSEIFLFEWRDLFTRDERINEKLAELAFAVLKNNEKRTVEIGIDWHTISETFSQGMHDLNVKHKYLSPLFDESNQVVAFVAISNVELLASKLINQPPEQLRRKEPKNETSLQ